MSQSDTVTLSTGLGADIVRYWGETLRRLNTVKVNILDGTLNVICKGAKNLEQLTIDVPRDMSQVMYPHSKHLVAPFLTLIHYYLQLNLFVGALVPCKQLHTIVDARPLSVHSQYQGLSPALAAGHINSIMREITSVQKIFTGKRCWTVCVYLLLNLNDCDG
jgi:hypothetical protein